MIFQYKFVLSKLRKNIYKTSQFILLDAYYLCQIVYL